MSSSELESDSDGTRHLNLHYPTIFKQLAKSGQRIDHAYGLHANVWRALKCVFCMFMNQILMNYYDISIVWIFFLHFLCVISFYFAVTISYVAYLLDGTNILEATYCAVKLPPKTAFPFYISSRFGNIAYYFTLVSYLWDECICETDLNYVHEMEVKLNNDICYIGATLINPKRNDFGIALLSNRIFYCCKSVIEFVFSFKCCLKINYFLTDIVEHIVICLTFPILFFIFFIQSLHGFIFNVFRRNHINYINYIKSSSWSALFTLFYQYFILPSVIISILRCSLNILYIFPLLTKTSNQHFIQFVFDAVQEGFKGCAEERKMRYHLLKTVHFNNGDSYVEKEKKFNNYLGIRSKTIAMKWLFYIFGVAFVGYDPKNNTLHKNLGLNAKQLNELFDSASLLVALFNDVYCFDCTENEAEYLMMLNCAQVKLKNNNININDAMYSALEKHKNYHSKATKFFLNELQKLSDTSPDYIYQFLLYLLYGVDGVYKWCINAPRYTSRRTKLFNTFSVSIEISI